MSNKRGADQRLLTVPAKANFLDGLDRALPKCGYSNRSQFVRDAIREKLQKEGIRVPKALTLAAGRYPTPKGGGFESKKTTSQRIRKAADAIVADAAEGVLRRRGGGGRDPSDPGQASPDQPTKGDSHPKP